MQEKVLLAHGGGGILTSELISEKIATRFSNPILDRMDDSGILPEISGKIAFTTDSYTVSPVFFPGGNIGDLAVCGTVNDIAMAGAEPLYLSLALIIEEGLLMSELDSILDSIQEQAQNAGVSIVTGDTKVVPKGEVDSIFINTAGIGRVYDGVSVSASNATPGDAIIVSGSIGVHGLAVMLARESFKFDSDIVSDVAPLNSIVKALVNESIQLNVLRDLTRGGLSMALYDIASASNITVEIQQATIPTTSLLDSACEILGLDPLHVAGEGCFMAVVPYEFAEKALAVIHRISGTSSAAIIGRVKERSNYRIEMKTPIGSTRVITPPRGELLPRIC